MINPYESKHIAMLLILSLFEGFYIYFTLKQKTLLLDSADENLFFSGHHKTSQASSSIPSPMYL